MTKNLRWRIIAIVAVTLLAVWSFTPPSKKIHLGLDLRGGVHLVLQVQTDDALRVETETTADQFHEALKAAKIEVASVKPVDLTTFAVEGVPAGSDQQFRTIADQQVGQSFDRDTVGGNYTFKMKPNVVVNHRNEAVAQALQTIERRVNELGVSEPIISPYGSAGDRIMVELPGVTDVSRAKEIIRSTALLELKLVEAGPMSDQAALLQPYGGKKPDDMDIVPGSDGAGGATTYYLVRHTAAITGRDLRNAKQTIDENNAPAVGFTLSSEGIAKFTRVTEANVGRQLAIILDNRVQSAPVIEGRISQADARITGRFTPQEASDLALILRSGALPASLTYLEQREVGPTLGQDSIRAGIMASLIGLLFVTLFMLFYYRLAGVNAIVSVAMNLVILLGCMAYLGAVLTLPGIAGFILTIGIGVDSNVLIFERIREELRGNKGPRQAVAAGFDRVFITILDTHIASLISAAFLFQFGTGPIRGFATTLVFGLLSNVFTAVFVSRTLFMLALARKPATEPLSI
ncbi:MAG TPA: protein translocase subunit SecD [Vicinamibacterales bacterium]|nr:protein translocase subunit SecD [Vicinamibacterales bacterium]